MRAPLLRRFAGRCMWVYTTYEDAHAAAAAAAVAAAVAASVAVAFDEVWCRCPLVPAAAALRVSSPILESCDLLGGGVDDHHQRRITKTESNDCFLPACIHFCPVSLSMFVAAVCALTQMSLPACARSHACMYACMHILACRDACSTILG